MTQATLTREGLESKSITQLKTIAKTAKVPGYTKFKGGQESALIDAIMAKTEQPTAIPVESKVYPFASSDAVPTGIYCHCGNKVPTDASGDLDANDCSCGLKFDENVDMDTVHGTHRIIHPVGMVLDVCPLDGESLSEAPATAATTTSATPTKASSAPQTGIWAQASVENEVLSYENSSGVVFTLNLTDLVKLKDRFGDDYLRKALVKSVELACVQGCDSTWSPRASFIEKVIEAVSTKSEIPIIHPVDPRHDDCWLTYCRSNDNMLASARMEKIETPDVDELNELKKHPWSMEDGRVYHNNGDPTMAFSFDSEDATQHPNSTAHLHKCHGPRCKFMIRTYAGWALEQATKADEGKDFAFLSSFAKKHDSCQEQAKKIRDADRAELAATAPAEPAPAPKVETPAPEAPVAPAPAAVAAAPEPVPAPSIKVMPDVHASAPTEFEEAPVAPAPAAVTPAPEPVPATPVAPAPAAAAPYSSETAQVIMAVGSLLSGMKQTDVAKILEALPAQEHVDVAEIIRAAGTLNDKSTEQLGEVAKVAQTQLGSVVSKLIEERASNHASTISALRDLPGRVHHEIFGDVDPEASRRDARDLSVQDPTDS